MSDTSLADEVDPANPSYNPWGRVFSHILQKGWQAGSLVGSLAVGPILAYRSGQVEVLLSTAGRAGGIGICLAGALGVAVLHDQSTEDVEERVYRLYYNANQNRTDTFCQVGSLVGAGVAGAMIQQNKLPQSVWSVAGGAAMGTAVALVAHGVTAPKKVEHEGKYVPLSKQIKDSIDKMG